MHFLSMFKKSIKKRLLLIKRYIPENHKQCKQYNYYVEYLEFNEFALALESLIELFNETEHGFSNKFWEELYGIAIHMKLHDEGLYCKIQSNKSKVKQINN